MPRRERCREVASPAEFADMIRREYAIWGAVVRQVGAEARLVHARAPSTTRVCPVMKSLSGEAKKNDRATRSSGFCRRLSARSAAAAERILMMPSARILLESVLPGATQLTQMPCCPSSCARVRVKPSTPAFRSDVVDAARRALQGRARADVDDSCRSRGAPHVRHDGARSGHVPRRLTAIMRSSFLDLDLVERRARHRHGWRRSRRC